MDRRVSVTGSAAACEDARNAPSVWLPGLIQHIVSFLPCNEIPCTIRLLSTEASRWFSSPAHRTILVAQPLPRRCYQDAWLRDVIARELPLSAREKLVNAAAATGCLEWVEAAADAAGLVLTGKVSAAACAAGQLQLCERLAGQDCPFHCDALPLAAASGNQALCEWLLRTDRGAWAPEVLISALEKGHLALAEWLVARCPPRVAASAKEAPGKGRLTPVRVLRAAALGCTMQQLQQLWPKMAAPLLPDEVQDAAGGDVWRAARITQQQQQQLQPLGSGVHLGQEGTLRQDELQAVLEAAVCSRTPCWRVKVLFVVARGARKTYAAYCNAAELALELGPVGRLRWLKEQGWPAPNRSLPEGGAGAQEVLDAPPLLAAASKRGNLEAVRWVEEELGVDPAAVDINRAWLVLAAAAGSGGLAVLRYLHERGLRSMRLAEAAAVAGAAARRGSAEVLDWLVDVALPAWLHQPGEARESARKAALGRFHREAEVHGAREGHLPVLAWAHQRAPLEGGVLTVYQAVCRGSAAMLAWLHAEGLLQQQGDQMGDTFALVAHHGDLLTLRTLHRLGYSARCPPGDALVMSLARDNARLPVLRWLAEHTGLPQSAEQWAAAERAASQRQHCRAEVEAWLAGERRRQRQQ